MQSWRKFWALARWEQVWLLRALFWLPLLNGARSVLGLRRLQHLLVWLTPVKPVASDQLALAQATALARLIDIAAYYGPYRATCLRRSLLLWWWLRCAGIAGELRIGVQRAGSHFAAHAWVEVGGVVANDSSAIPKQFVAFPEDHFERLALN